MIDGGVAVCQDIFSERGTANREREIHSSDKIKTFREREKKSCEAKEFSRTELRGGEEFS